MQVVAKKIGSFPVALRIVVAQTLFERMRGLLMRPAPLSAEGMLISRCRAIHTLGMAYPIDVVFIDRDWQIVGVVAHVAPGRWKLAAPRRSGCAHVLELADGEAQRMQLRNGLRFEATGGQDGNIKQPISLAA